MTGLVFLATGLYFFLAKIGTRDFGTVVGSESAGVGVESGDCCTGKAELRATGEDNGRNGEIDKTNTLVGKKTVWDICDRELKRKEEKPEAREGESE